MQRIIGWGHEDLIFILNGGPKFLFVDCTFSCVPKGFSQCLVIMMYDPASHLYMPVFHVLLQSKEENVYKHALHLCVTTANWKIDALSICCDFESGLINAIQHQFSRKPIIGCVFHWKQAMRRKLKDNHIPQPIITTLMGPDGLMNILTQIAICDIENKGIPYIRSRCNYGEQKKTF
jgi:hypothetical protein